MLELNLLPKELRKGKEIDLPEIPVLLISSVLFAVVLGLHIISLAVIMNKEAGVKRNKEEFEVLKPKIKEVAEVNLELKTIEARLKTIENISTIGIDWAELLNGINDAVIPDVWLTEFRTIFKDVKSGKNGYKKVLSAIEITGNAVGQERATSTVGKFIDSLKWSESFSKYFENVKLQNMREGSIDNENVMIFKLECTFKNNINKKV